MASVGLRIKRKRQSCVNLTTLRLSNETPQLAVILEGHVAAKRAADTLQEHAQQGPDVHVHKRSPRSERNQ